MYRFDAIKRKQNFTSEAAQPAFLLLSSDPHVHDTRPDPSVSFGYHNRYLVKRRVMRTIRRLQREQPR